MSGLEGLAALGLACNIFQIISFGRETLGLVKSVYRDGTLDNSLMDKITAIQVVASNIIDVNIPQSGNQEKKLVDVTKKCTSVARDLQEEIAFLVDQNGQGSLRATLKITTKANWRKRRIERMEKALSDAEQLMQTTLLAWIFKSAHTANTNIDSLGHEVRNFVIKYEQGSRQTSQLVSSEALQVRELVVRQSGKTKEALRAHIMQTSEKFEQKFEHQIQQVDRERRQAMLLKSLKYPGMNERANQVENAHAGTFGWLFADADDSSHSDGKSSYFRSSEEPDDQSVRRENDWSDIDTDDESEEEPPEVAWSSFTDWLQSDLSMYWIMGKPGSGKSTLAKFILSEPRTKIALQTWRPGAIIVSHYFWRPGALLQRSIKGMLCSITYQLVFSLPNAVEYASANVAGLSHKDADTDWSVSELQELCLGLIRHCGKPLCLFIDGLDECGPEDDHQKLLDTLERIKLPNVKIIASSRNEPVFEKRFRHEPQLRMQDLAAGDLHIYAMDMLPHEIKDDLCEVLVQKAEGVFLWLVLAAQSINRGFSNGESLAELDDRIKSLPNGLNDLYKDMWERLNEDGDLYRESAALYFKLVMASHDSGLRFLKYGWSILDMMLASLPKTNCAFAKETVISTSQAVKECEEFFNKVRVRCAGLLGLCGRLDDFPSTKGLRDEERALLKYAKKWQHFRFIHRSAYDFLVGTEEGQNILRHDATSSMDINICILSAGLRAFELLGPMLGNLKEHRWSVYNLHQKLEDYLADLSSIADARYGAARELTSLCYKLYSSSRLPVRHGDATPTRAAVFIGVAATYPNLVLFATSIFRKKLAGSDDRSAVLLSLASARCNWECNQVDMAHPQRTFPLKLTRWLLRLPEVNVNLKCPVVGLLNKGWDSGAISPLEHIMVSPFAKLLSSGLLRLDWREAESTRHRHRATQFLRLISDFVLQGANFHTTVFLAFRLDYLVVRARPDRQEVFPGFFQIPDCGITEWCDSHQNGDGILCVVTLQATTIIERMLASFLKTGSGHESINEDEYSTEEGRFNFETDECSAWDLEKVISFLSRRCQESSSESNNRVLGFLQPYGNIDNMPYRQVSEQDSAQLVEMIWECLFEDGLQRDDLEISCREVVMRSPFSSIGFKDYMRDIGCFDELAAHKLQLEYQHDAHLIISGKKTWGLKDPKTKELLSRFNHERPGLGLITC